MPFGLDTPREKHAELLDQRLIQSNMKSITASLGGAVFVAVGTVVAGGVFDQFPVIEVCCRTDEKQWCAFLNFQQFGAVFVGCHET